MSETGIARWIVRSHAEQCAEIDIRAGKPSDVIALADQLEAAALAVMAAGGFDIRTKIEGVKA